MKSHIHTEESDEQSKVVAAAADDGKQVEGTVKGATKHSEGVESTTWLPGWNLSGLTQLTGAVTNTVKYCHTAVVVVVVFSVDTFSEPFSSLTT